MKCYTSALPYRRKILRAGGYARSGLDIAGLPTYKQIVQRMYARSEALTDPLETFKLHLKSIRPRPEFRRKPRTEQSTE